MEGIIKVVFLAQILKKTQKKHPTLYHTKSEVEGAGVSLAVATKLCLSRQKTCFVATICFSMYMLCNHSACLIHLHTYIDADPKCAYMRSVSAQEGKNSAI